MPVLLNGTLMVEVPTSVLVKVPALFITAAVPSSATPRLAVEIVSAPVVASVNVAPLRIVSVPEPTALNPVLGLVAFRLMPTEVPLVVLAPFSCSVRPPSNPLLPLNVAPCKSIVVPALVCGPPGSCDAGTTRTVGPGTGSTAEPVSSPRDCVNAG